MVPQHSDIDSRNDCSLKTKFSKNVPLNIPIVSSPMDTVTEAEMAMEIARNGGLGIIHRFMSIEDQAKQIEKVKRAEAFILTSPIIVKTTDPFSKIKSLITETGVSTFLVTDEDLDCVDNLKSPRRKKSLFDESSERNYNLAGILTKRDIKKFVKENETVESAMTSKEKLKTWTLCKPPPSPIFFYEMMIEAKVEKIPVVNDKGKIWA